METQWDQPAEASVSAVSALCVTDVAPSHQLALGLWRASLAVGQCPGASLVGLRAGTWGQGAPCNASSERGHQEPAGPCWVCQPEGCSVGPQLALRRGCGWGFRGDGLGERTLSTHSQECSPWPPESTSSPWYGMSGHLIITSHHPSHPLPFHLE